MKNLNFTEDEYKNLCNGAIKIVKSIDNKEFRNKMNECLEIYIKYNYKREIFDLCCFNKFFNDKIAFNIPSFNHFIKEFIYNTKNIEKGRNG